MIICYQYKIFSYNPEFKPVYHFAKNIDDVFKYYYFGRNGGCYAICGWKVKKWKVPTYKLMNK